MRAMLLAGGLGTRLRPITDAIPKCLVPIYGKPLLQIWLERLADSGIGPVLVNTHYMASTVEGFITNSPFLDQVTLAHELELLGTAGTLIENMDFFQGEDGMLIHADNYCLADLCAFSEAHKSRPEQCMMTMMTFRTDDPPACGIVEVDDAGVVVDFHEKVVDPPGNQANGAVYILSNEMLQELSANSVSIQDFSTEVLPLYLGKIYTYCTAELFVDIGTPKNYQPYSDLKTPES